MQWKHALAPLPYSAKPLGGEGAGSHEERVFNHMFFCYLFGCSISQKLIQYLKQKMESLNGDRVRQNKENKKLIICTSDKGI